MVFLQSFALLSLDSGFVSNDTMNLLISFSTFLQKICFIRNKVWLEFVFEIHSFTLLHKQRVGEGRGPSAKSRVPNRPFSGMPNIGFA